MKDCDTCKYADADIDDPHCVGCYDSGNLGRDRFPKWTPLNSKNKSEK